MTNTFINIRMYVCAWFYIISNLASTFLKETVTCMYVCIHMCMFSFIICLFFLLQHRERIGNFKIEPPGLFRGRGDHPKQGMIKVCVYN